MRTSLPSNTFPHLCAQYHWSRGELRYCTSQKVILKYLNSLPFLLDCGFIQLSACFSSTEVSRFPKFIFLLIMPVDSTSFFFKKEVVSFTNFKFTGSSFVNDPGPFSSNNFWFCSDFEDEILIYQFSFHLETIHFYHFNHQLWLLLGDKKIFLMLQYFIFLSNYLRRGLYHFGPFIDIHFLSKY